LNYCIQYLAHPLSKVFICDRNADYQRNIILVPAVMILLLHGETIDFNQHGGKTGRYTKKNKWPLDRNLVADDRVEHVTAIYPVSIESKISRGYFRVIAI